LAILCPAENKEIDQELRKERDIVVGHELKSVPKAGQPAQRWSEALESIAGGSIHGSEPPEKVRSGSSGAGGGGTRGQRTARLSSRVHEVISTVEKDGWVSPESALQTCNLDVGDEKGESKNNG